MEHKGTLENSWQAFAETGEVGAFLIYAAMRRQLDCKEE